MFHFVGPNNLGSFFNELTISLHATKKVFMVTAGGSIKPLGRLHGIRITT